MKNFLYKYITMATTFAIGDWLVIQSGTYKGWHAIVCESITAFSLTSIKLKLKDAVSGKMDTYETVFRGYHLSPVELLTQYEICRGPRRDNDMFLPQTYVWIPRMNIGGNCCG